ncbi:MAG: malto-oligosyltrehalose synthase, partial [Proteobacteria bacterium]|nr:malto-oligosyltrehalose synthase [Pseudomonadota bacterium]
LVVDMADGRVKLYTIWQSLALRARWPEVFRDGDYLPLTVRGERAAHACAFARRCGNRAMIALVPRLPTRLLGDRNILPMGAEVWGDTVLEVPIELAGLEWSNVFTGERYMATNKFELGQLLAYFPICLLAAEGA